MNTINLLVADDEQLECDAVELLVSKCGYDISVIKAHNGREAVEFARINRPCIIFLDIQMPGMNGLDAAEQIRTFLPDTYIVFLTAWGRFEFAQKAIQLKADEYLLKPIDEEKMKALLDRFMAGLKERSQTVAEENSAIYENMTIQQKVDSIQKKVLGGDSEHALEEEQSLFTVLYETYGHTPRAAHELYEIFLVFCFDVCKSIPFLYQDKPTAENAQLLETTFSSFIQKACIAVQTDKRDKYERIFSIIMDYIGTHYMNELSVENIAGQFGMNPSYFTQLFPKYCGKTFVEYLTDVRMKEAARLLSGGWSVRDTAQSAGFTDTNYFGKVFRRYYDCAPSEFAQNQAESEKKR